MNETQDTPTPEPETEPTETEPETTPEPEPEETEPESEPEAKAPAEPTTYAGVTPLDSVEAVLGFHGGSEGEWHGSLDPESLETSGTELGKTAVRIHRATDSLARAYRTLCELILDFRSEVYVERKDGSIGPDWAGDSPLCQRFTALTVSKPLAEAGADTARIRSILNQMSVYMGRKLPDKDYTLRDHYITEWARKQGLAAGQEYKPSELASRVDAESAATGLKSAAMSRAARQDNTAGPGTDTGTNPLTALGTAVKATVKAGESGTDLNEAALIREAHGILTTLAVQVMRNRSKWSNRPQALEVFGPFYALVESLRENIDGKQESYDEMIANLLGKAAKDAAAKIVSDEETSTETEATEAASA